MESAALGLQIVRRFFRLHMLRQMVDHHMPARSRLFCRVVVFHVICPQPEILIENFDAAIRVSDIASAVLRLGFERRHGWLAFFR